MTDIEGFLTIYGHSDNLLNNNDQYWPKRQTFDPKIGGSSSSCMVTWIVHFLDKKLLHICFLMLVIYSTLLLSAHVSIFL